jgi:predicted nucleic-acid-binding protein
MIGLDTNVLVRYIMQDDAKQSAVATRLIEGLSEDAPGFITLVSVIELTWVLEFAFALNRSQIVEVFQRMMSVDVFKLDRAGVVQSALRTYSNGKADFADCLIERLSAQAGCDRTMTFDRNTAKTGRMVLIA